MASLPRFLRKEPALYEDIGIDIQVTDAPTEPSLHTQFAHPEARPRPFTKPANPVRKALMARIAFVSVEENADLPALLYDDGTPSRIVQRIMLPRNPRIAGDELYELDGMDMIVVVSEEERRISKDTMRWLKLLKQLGVPMLVLLPYVPTRRREQEKIDEFSQYVGLPVVTVTADKLDEARQAFLVTAMRIAPATGLALAAHMPHFRPPLMRNLFDAAIEDSLLALEAGDADPVQVNLVQQICAAYGHNGQQFEQHRVALETLVKATRHYTTRFAARFPIRDPQRRIRLTNALSTLFIGYAVTVYLGATPPSFRKEMLPQIWRLYRASGKSVLE